MNIINFTSLIEESFVNYPIIKASDYKFNWQKEMHESYMQKISIHNSSSVNHTYKCPGIYEICHKGFIVQMPWDLNFFYDISSNYFYCTSPSQHVQNLFFPDQIVDLFSIHNGSNTAMNIVQKPGYFKDIIKITLPWKVCCPNNTKLLIIPIPYPDDYSIQHTYGILDTKISTTIHAHIYLKEFKNEYTIKAGTPLMQIIPIETNKFDFSVEYKPYAKMT